MNEIINNIVSAESGGLIDLGKALRKLLVSGGSGGGAAAANLSEFLTGTDDSKYISPAIFFGAQVSHTLMDAETITVNMNNGFNFLLTLAADRVIGNPINYKVGQSGIFVIQQDATGGHNPTWGSDWKFFNNTPPTIPQDAHAWILLRYYVQAANVVRVTYEGAGGSALNAATVGEIRAGLESLKYISPARLIEADALVTLIEESPVFIDLGEGRNFSLTLTASRTIDAPLDQKPGRSGEIIIRQNAVGGHALTWHADWKFPQGEVSIATAPNQSTTLRYLVESVGSVRVTPYSVYATRSDFWRGDSSTQAISPFVAFDSQEAIDLGVGTSITPDFDAGMNFFLSLTQNVTINNPTNIKRSQSGMFCIQQAGDGDNEVAWGASYRFVDGVAPVVPKTVGFWAVIPYFVLSLSPLTILCSSVDANAYFAGGSSLIQSATAVEVRAGTVDTKYISPAGLSESYAPVIVADAETILPDLSNGKNFIITLGGNRTIANITNQRVGNEGFFIIFQDATGGRLATWGNNYQFTNGPPTLPTAPGSWIIFPYYIQDLGIIRCVTPITVPIPDSATVAEYREVTVATKYLSPLTVVQGAAPVELPYAATIAVNFKTGINFKITLTGDASIENPTNQVAGQEGKFIIYQNGTGGRAVSWGNNYKFSVSPPTIPAAAGAFMIVSYYVEAPGTVLAG